MRRVYLLTVTALIEMGAGLLLLLVPWLPIELLFGAEPPAAETIVIARIAGAAVLSLGTVCGLARKDEPSGAATGVIAAMLLYNAAAAVILAVAGLRSTPCGIGLWPAVVLHTAMGAWCLACLPGRWIDEVK